MKYNKITKICETWKTTLLQNISGTHQNKLVTLRRRLVFPSGLVPVQASLRLAPALAQGLHVLGSAPGLSGQSGLSQAETQQPAHQTTPQSSQPPQLMMWKLISKHSYKTCLVSKWINFEWCSNLKDGLTWTIFCCCLIYMNVHDKCLSTHLLLTKCISSPTSGSHTYIINNSFIIMPCHLAPHPPIGLHFNWGEGWDGLSSSLSFISTLPFNKWGQLKECIRPGQGLGIPCYDQEAVEVVCRDALRVILPHVHKVILNGLGRRGWSDYRLPEII